MSKSPVGPIIDRINRKRTSEAGGPSPSHSQTQHEAGTRSTCVVRARGPSLGLKTWKKAGVPINIESNEWDQPIGDDSVELETHLGVLARNNQLAPLTFNDWRVVPLDLKKLMWSEIERKFNPSIHLKKHIFKSIGKKWKDYKSRLKAVYYDPKLSIIERVANLPPRVHEEQWFIINQFWDSEKGKVLREDRHGYVRTFGLGPSPSDVFGLQPTRMDYKRMADHAIKSFEERVHAMEEQMSGMQKTIEEMTMQIQSMKMAMENMSSVRVNATQHLDYSDSFPPNSSQMHGMHQMIEEMTSQMQTMQSTIKSLQAFNVKQLTMPSALFKSASATRVDLLSFETPREVVAQGRVVSKDPNKDFGGFKLGPHFWEVYVEIAIREKEILIRPRGHFFTIKEVVSSTIAWPSSKKGFLGVIALQKRCMNKEPRMLPFQLKCFCVWTNEWWKDIHDDWSYQDSKREFLSKFSIVEIYNESVRDLLSVDSISTPLLDDPENYFFLII
ncbi:hypothetical protein BUALT_Bualt01G0196800 [Buddleja alternifolia]|uniref:Transposase Tnp1/En/Spm-like domain-containing protein n=1 Tax=Buddleja alternifolia TaxID=168488 RepID=A0AAV6YIY9_9LAMI|nr:hypothetical protein BUALT_Bualt01G0196800 [Buddleja alternifolia]